MELDNNKQMSLKKTEKAKAYEDKYYSEVTSQLYCIWSITTFTFLLFFLTKVEYQFEWRLLYCTVNNIINVYVSVICPGMGRYVIE